MQRVCKLLDRELDIEDDNENEDIIANDIFEIENEDIEEYTTHNNVLSFFC